MQSCSVCRRLRVVPGCYDDYKQLSHYHYREGSPGPFTAIFALKPERTLPGASHRTAVGVIVYSTATPELELRNVATDNFFTGFDVGTKLALINGNIRRITRLIIDPRFRGLGLASSLVRQTMPEMNVPIIEAVAVMGLINPFFEKAGMKAYAAKTPTHTVRLIEAFSVIKIEDAKLIDAEGVQRRLDRLSAREAQFIDLEIRRFLQNCGRRRNMQPGLERTRYALSKLAARPVYYIWFNPAFDARCSIADARGESAKENQ
jgi:hypothetical protein